LGGGSQGGEAGQRGGARAAMRVGFSVLCVEEAFVSVACVREKENTERKEKRRKEKGRKEKGRKEKNMENFPNMKISEK
jgi:hypothetical protein